MSDSESQPSSRADKTGGERRYARSGCMRGQIAWFHDPPARGAWNMALDEALLQRAAVGTSPVLRFYQWEAPTLSLGYFQQFADRDAHRPSAGCALVRRATGGGAILHDRELTYGCVLPAGHPFGRKSTDLYDAIHQAIVSVLAGSGVAAQLVECTSESQRIAGCAARDRGSQTFLCFERRTAGDVLLDGWKIAGSAQRRSRGAVLQHGSILLDRSPFAPELPGINDLADIRFEANEFAELLRQAIAERLRCELVSCPADERITEDAVAIEASKFASEHWLLLR